MCCVYYDVEYGLCYYCCWDCCQFMLEVVLLLQFLCWCDQVDQVDGEYCQYEGVEECDVFCVYWFICCLLVCGLLLCFVVCMQVFYLFGWCFVCCWFEFVGEVYWVCGYYGCVVYVVVVGGDVDFVYFFVWLYEEELIQCFVFVVVVC